MSTAVALSRLMDDLVTLYQHYFQSLPYQQFDPKWLSACQVGECFARTPGKSQDQAQVAYIHWQPVGQQPAQSFETLENGLDLSIHESVKDYYTLFWSDGFTVSSKWGNIDLIQVWNEEDFQRLLENLVGHIISQKGHKKAHRLSFFIGCMSDTDECISVLNATGQVVVEAPGSNVPTIIASDLSAFLASVSPVLSQDDCRSWQHIQNNTRSTPI